MSGTSKQSFVSLLFVTSFLAACGQSQTADEPLSSGDDRVVWENSTAALNGGTVTVSLATLLTLTATINPPTGTYANNIFVKGSTAYVAYNTPGATAAGAIDQLNLSVAAYPVRSATFTSATDVNDVFVEGNTVYSIGADGVNGSTLQTLTAGNNAFSAVTNTYYLPSYAGTAVKHWNGNLFALTGNTGGLNIFSPNSIANATTSTLAITDARGMDQSGGSNLWVVAGGGNVYEVSSSGTILKTLTFAGANNIAESKSSIHVGSKMAAVSLGTQGAALICLSDHKTIATIAAPTVTGIASSLTVSNAVTYGDGLMFVANGEAGVYVYSITNPLISNVLGGLLGTSSACGNVSVNYQGYLNLGSTSHYSANNVYYSNGILYVATGSGGLKVLTVNFSVLSIVSGLLNSL